MTVGPTDEQINDMVKSIQTIRSELGRLIAVAATPEQALVMRDKIEALRERCDKVIDELNGMRQK